MKSMKTGRVSKIKVKKVEKSPYTVDRSVIRRFDSRDTIFNRVMWDTSWPGNMKMYDEVVPALVTEGRPGYSRVDFSLSYAPWIIHDAFKGGFSWKKIKPYKNPVATIGIDWTRTKYEVKDPSEMSVIVKRAARFFGASLVGVCELNRDWLYADVDVPKKCDNVVVMAVEMDLNGIATSPAAPAATATGVGYSKMAFVLALMGEFIRNLGYEALQCGNDTALSIPLAIDAGLGELGRNGLLITPQYGPRIRLCKVITDLPLKPNKPIMFGVREYCRKCKLCAENCKAAAISMDEEPSFRVLCRSNNPGALKWYVDVERCYLYWCENGIDCSSCITVCPFNSALSEQSSLSSEKFWEPDEEQSTLP